jgi:hypothetical protein
VFVSEWHPPDPQSYSYLLGVYLGDGCLTVTRGNRGAQLVIACDAAYPALMDESWAALVLTSLNGPVCRVTPRGQRCVRLQSAWKGWIAALPQHGPGRKHERVIVLEPWQQAIVGVRWTQSNPRNISVSHRRSVALLDEWIGPKG